MLYRPVPHFTHVDCPVDDWYHPAVHERQLSLLVFECLPVAHATQDEAPLELTLPASHPVHTPPADLNLPAGHLSQFTAPTAADIDPTAQSTHAALPFVS